MMDYKSSRNFQKVFRMKKFLIGLGSALGVIAPALAEEGTGSGTTANAWEGIVTVTEVEGIFTASKSAMNTMLTKAMPVIIAFVGGGLIIWGALALLGVIKKGFAAGKGR